jgi:hypothetical protein
MRASEMEAATVATMEVHGFGFLKENSCPWKPDIRVATRNCPSFAHFFSSQYRRLCKSPKM